MNEDASRAFYQALAREQDMGFRPLNRTWFKLSGHGITADIRLDTSTGGEVVTVITQGPSRTAEHMIIAAQEWRKAKEKKA